MKRLITTVAAALAALAFVSVASVPSASAHERRQVAGGKFTFVVGFFNEPVLLEEVNAVLIRVSNTETTTPIEGVEKTLKVDVTAGGQTKTYDLAARSGMPGTYTAELIPTKSGQWVFRFHGTVEGTPIDERFESGAGRFGEPASPAELQFPVKVPTNSEIASQSQTAGRPAEASAQPAGASQDDVQRALDKANSARNTAVGFGIAGIVVGVLGVALAAYALTSRRGGARGAEPV